MGDFIFKTIKTPGGSYLYDRNTNTIVVISREELEELRRVEEGILPERESTVLQKYQSLGVLAPNIVEEIHHPDTEYLEHYANCRIGQLVLQVTQQCNLRCAYCVYSGNYYTREHSDKKMSWETAKKAIDYVIDHSCEVDDVCFSFYGGEPLLEINLIRRCVEYVKARMEGKKYRFSMTTNGTLLNPNTVAFLAENDVSLSVSLDGPREDHDANRRFRNGGGSFDTIAKNIRYIKENHYDYWEKIMFLITLNPKVDVDNINRFFDQSELFAKGSVKLNEIEATNLKNPELVEYGDKYYLSRRFKYLKVLMALAGMLEESQVDRIYAGTLSAKKNAIKTLKKGRVLQRCMHHSGPCIPGVQKLFVAVDGTFYPCEKVSENEAELSVGSLEKGLDMVRMKQMLNLGELTKEQCQKCWAFQDCKICIARMENIAGEKILTAAQKQKVCEETREEFFSVLYEYCVIQECMAKRRKSR